MNESGTNNDASPRNELVPLNNQQSRPTSTSFFAIFYERPVRHRYYRQLNRSATNLVRRLSQSRLFVNSTRAQNAAYRNNYMRNRSRQDTTNSQTTDAEIETESQAILNTNYSNQIDAMNIINNDIGIDHDNIDDDNTDEMHQLRGGSIHSLRISNEHNQNRRNAMRSVASENDIFRNCERGETPPPPYNVVAHNIHS